MPLAIAALLRYLIMAAASAIPLTAAQELLDGTFKQIVEAIKDEEGLTLEEAKDILSNILVDLVINTATLAVVLKGKIGLKAADWLGLSKRGFSKKALAGKAATVEKKLAASGGLAIAKKVIVYAGKALIGIGGLVWTIKALADIIEPGIYQPKQTNEIYRKLGIPFQYPERKGSLQPGPFDAAGFTEYARQLEDQGITSIINPNVFGPVKYTRQDLADLIDYFTGKEAASGITSTKKNIITKIAPYLYGANGNKLSATTSPTSGSTASGTSTAGVSVPSVKVFAGVMSQGVLGEQMTFTERQDDLINSMDELQTAAVNNLVPWISSLLGRIIYEIKLVASVQTRKGTTLYGGTTRIVSSYDSKGNARYKNVTNRFAIMNLYAMTDKNTRVKLAQITLGPTDAVALQPTLAQLAELTSRIGPTAITTDIGEVKTIATAQPITITTPQATLSAAARTETTQPSTTAQAPAPTVSPSVTTAAPVATPVQSAPAPAVSVPAPSAPAPAWKSAKTLSEFYSLTNRDLPSLEKRALMYSNAGLGPKEFYAGTAEQNTRLLNWLLSAYSPD